MKAKLFKGKDRKWYFRFVARNNRTVAQSEGYARRVDCLKTVLLIAKMKLEVIEEDAD